MVSDLWVGRYLPIMVGTGTYLESSDWDSSLGEGIQSLFRFYSLSNFLLLLQAVIGSDEDTVEGLIHGHNDAGSSDFKEIFTSSKIFMNDKVSCIMP